LSLHDAWTWLAGLPFRGKVLAFAVLVVLIELGFRRWAPKARAYKLWTRAFESIGKVWTAVLLAIIYLFSVGPISVFMRLFARDPLDRSLAQEPSFWRSHEPNPLGPHAAARHQF
jgi:hypothetical protein